MNNKIKFGIILLMVMVLGFVVRGSQAHEACKSKGQACEDKKSEHVHKHDEKHEHKGTCKDEHKHDHKDHQAHSHEHGHDHDHDHDHEHGLLENAGTLPIAELQKIECEHDLMSVDCNDCRYEIGAVKNTPSLSKMIKLDVVSLGKLDYKVPFSGELEYDSKLVKTLSSMVAGVVADMRVRLGDVVEKGQPVAVLESRELASAVSELRKLMTELELAQKIFDREQKLSERKIGSQEAVQQAKATYDGLVIEKERRIGELRMMGMSQKELEQAQSKGALSSGFGRVTLVAPSKGRISKIFLGEGSVVSEYEAVLEVSDISQLRVTGYVNERDMGKVLRKLDRGAIVGYLNTRAFGERSFELRAVSSDVQISQKSRRLGVFMEVENGDGHLRPGMFAEGFLLMGDNGSKPILPVSAVLEDEGRYFVFVKEGDMFFTRDVGIENDYGEQVVVSSGLKLGDVYVREGAFLLKSDVLREKMGAGCAH